MEHFNNVSMSANQCMDGADGLLSASIGFFLLNVRQLYDFVLGCVCCKMFSHVFWHRLLSFSGLGPQLRLHL